MNNKQICFREKSAERKAAAIEDDIANSSEDLKRMILDHVKASIALRRAGDGKKVELEIV